MKPLPNFNFAILDTYPKSLAAIEEHIRLLVQIIEETPEPFSDKDREMLVTNIQWLKKFYEAAERNLLDGQQ